MAAGRVKYVVSTEDRHHNCICCKIRLIIVDPTIINRKMHHPTINNRKMHHPTINNRGFYDY